MHILNMLIFGEFFYQNTKSMQNYPAGKVVSFFGGVYLYYICLSVLFHFVYVNKINVLFNFQILMIKIDTMYKTWVY